MARFGLAHRNPLAPSVQRSTTLDVDASDPVARQIAADSHGGLLVLERGLNDRGVLRTVITVDETRETISFFGSTAAVEGWRGLIFRDGGGPKPHPGQWRLKSFRGAPHAPPCRRGLSRAAR